MTEDWTRAVDLKAQARRLWERGDIVRATLPGAALGEVGDADPVIAPRTATDTTLAFGSNDGPDDEPRGDSSDDPGEAQGEAPSDDSRGGRNGDSGDRPPGEPDTAPNAASIFPHRLRLRRPRSRDLATRFEAVRAWVREIDALPHVRVERRTVRHAELGTNTLPESVWLDDPERAAALAGRGAAFVRCRALNERLLAHDARLLGWLHRRPLALLEVADELERLLAVHAYMRARTRPGIHLREIDVAGVDGKFVEERRELLAEWLDLTLPAHAIDTAHRGVRGFARRYGYRDKPVRIRLRSLDPTRALIASVGSGSVARTEQPTRVVDAGGSSTATSVAARASAEADVDTETGVSTFAGTAESAACETDELALLDPLALADLTLDATSAALLRPSHARVVITENEVNFLTLPPLPGTLALFGAGYGFAELGALGWLAERDVFYWGDIDTHGFAILDELRGVLPAVRSVLMDRETLLAHRTLWGTEPKPRRGSLPRLDAAEARLYAELVDGVHGERPRLEQERIGHGWATARLRADVIADRAR